jgi:hypothetical protein
MSDCTNSAFIDASFAADYDMTTLAKVAALEPVSGTSHFRGK